MKTFSSHRLSDKVSIKMIFLTLAFLLTTNSANAAANFSGSSDDAPPDATIADEGEVIGEPVTERDLLGYRASLYPTDYPTERKNLNGTNSLMGVGFSRDVTVDKIVVDSIEMPYPVLLYTRDTDEVFVLGGTPMAIANYVSFIDGLPPGENETAPYIAKFNPETGEIVYLDLDRGTGIPYLGGALVHADGYVYVVFQNHLYRLEPESMVIETSVDLPTDGPGTVYNGLLVGRSGQLILKAMNFGNGEPTLSLIDPETLETVFSTGCACASARFALAVDETGVEHLYHLNREETFRYVVEKDSLTLDEAWIARFDPEGTGVNEEPTSPVIMDGRVFYTTNTSIRSTTPMRVFWQDVNATYASEMPPLGGPLLFEDPEGRTGFSFSGLSADTATGIVFANDQGRGLVNAFRPTDDGEIDILWQRELRVGSGNTSVSDRQMVYFTDYVDGSNHLVVLDVLTGDELLRIPTPATRATIGSILLMPNGDVYLASNEPGKPTGFLVRFSVP